MSYDYTYGYTLRTAMRQKAPKMLIQLYYGGGCSPSQGCAIPHRDAIGSPQQIARCSTLSQRMTTPTTTDSEVPQ